MSVTSEHYTLADADAEAIWFVGTLGTIKAMGSKTGGALSIVEFTHPPGFATPRHIHDKADEAFYVLEGTMRGFCGDQEWTAGPGAFVWLPRGILHGYAVEGDKVMRSLAIALPAGFDAFVREAGEPAGERAIPPPGAPDVPKLLAAAARAGIEHPDIPAAE